MVKEQLGTRVVVAESAHAAVLAEGRTAFADRYLEPLVSEARHRGLDADDLARLIHERFNTQKGPAR